MILIDFNAIGVSEAMALMGYEKGATEHDVESVVLNKISQISTKFKRKYGRTIICPEGKGNWRKDLYPLYKKNRKIAKKKSPYDWDMFYLGFNNAIETITEGLQWRVVSANMAEADDTIATLARRVQEPTLIVSRDSDFFQLHNNFIAQYDFQTSRMLKGDQSPSYFRDKFVKGSAKENIANIQMPIDHLTEGEGKQKSVTKKFLAGLELEGLLLARYDENKALMDLGAIPEYVVNDIVESFQASGKAPKPSIQYMGETLRRKGFRVLARNVEDFID